VVQDAEHAVGESTVNGFLAIGLVVIGLVGVALVILAFDVARGDVGGGRHTLARARRLLVVATDPAAMAGVDEWIEEQQREYPRMQLFVLEGRNDQESYMAVQEAIEQNRPDAVVVARDQHEPRATLSGMYGRLKEDLHIPVDAIYVESRFGR
jgi:DNA-binding transcriptional LysR family regulator